MRHIGVLTSGGDAPGMNAAIRAVVRTAGFHQCTVTGVLGGYNGLVNGEFRTLGLRDVSNIIQRGGTILRSARSEPFMTPEGREKAARHLRTAGIEGLITIGGNGTQSGAWLLSNEQGVRVIGVASTIDNDLGGTDTTIGFDTACQTAMEAIDRLRDTAQSHDRVFFVEVMGRKAGQIAARVALAAGAEHALVPERSERISDLIDALAGASRTKTSSIVVVAEGDEAGGAFHIARQVKEALPELDLRVSVLGHLQRGGSPTATDRELASRLGLAAVEALLAGRSGELAGMVKGEVVLLPLEHAARTPKPLPPDWSRIITVLSS